MRLQGCGVDAEGLVGPVGALGAQVDVAREAVEPVAAGVGLLQAAGATQRIAEEKEGKRVKLRKIYLSLGIRVASVKLLY